MTAALIVAAYLLVGLLTFLGLARTGKVFYSDAGFVLGTNLVLWPVVVVLLAGARGLDALDDVASWLLDRASRRGVSR